MRIRLPFVVLLLYLSSISRNSSICNGHQYIMPLITVKSICIFDLSVNIFKHLKNRNVICENYTQIFDKTKNFQNSLILEEFLLVSFNVIGANKASSIDRWRNWHITPKFFFCVHCKTVIYVLILNDGFNL